MQGVKVSEAIVFCSLCRIVKIHESHTLNALSARYGIPAPDRSRPIVVLLKDAEMALDLA